MNNFCSIY